MNPIDWSKVSLEPVDFDKHERVPGAKGTENMDPERWKALLDEETQRAERQKRGLVPVTDAGVAVAIVKLGYPHEVEFHARRPKAKPHDLTFWAPSWIETFFRAGMGESVAQALTDEEFRTTILDGIGALRNLKAAK